LSGRGEREGGTRIGVVGAMATEESEREARMTLSSDEGSMIGEKKSRIAR